MPSFCYILCIAAIFREKTLRGSEGNIEGKKRAFLKALFKFYFSVIFEGTEGCRLCSSSPVQELFERVQLPVLAVLPAVELH